jgi:hypothetical protein
MTLPLAEGELLYITDTQKMYVGGRLTPNGALEVGGIQITGYTNEDARDEIGSVLAAGPHSGIDIVYNDQAGTISATVDLSNYSGVITADAFKGSVFADDGSTMGGGQPLVDAVSGKINLDGTVKGNIIPDANETYDIGSSSFRFKDLYLSGSSIKLGDATINAVGSVVDLPVGSTVAGIPIIDADGSISSDITGSVFGVNSSVIVDATDNSLHTAFLDIVDDGILSQNSNLRFGSPTDPIFLQTWQPSNGSFFSFYGEIDPDSGDSPWLQLLSARGTNSNPAAAEVNDLLSGLLLFGYDGDDYTRSVTIAGVVDGVVSSGTVPGKLLILVQSSAPGAVAGDNQVLSFDSKGVLNAPIMQTGSYTSTQRDALTPAFGMMIYNTTANKFQGYQNTGGTTPEWVDLS